MKHDRVSMKIWLRDARICVWRTWALFFADFLFGVEWGLTHMIFEPTLRTWVRCGEVALDGGEHMFTGSALCGDRKYVIQQAARLHGWLGALEGIVSLVSMPLLGSFGDEYGRVPMLWVCIVGHALSLIGIITSRGSLPILVCAFLVRGVTAAFYTTFKAILGDLGGNRSLAYTVKALFVYAGHGVGWATALCILRVELLDYTRVWWVCMAIFGAGVAVATQISESLPSRRKSQDSLFHCKFIWEPFRLLIRDAFLRRWCAAKFFIILGMSVSFLLKSFVLAAFDWRQGRFEALLGIAGGLAATSTICAPALIRRFSTQVVVSRCVLLFATSVNFLVLAPLGPVFCLLPLLAKSSGACCYTAGTTLLADRYTEDQGKSQSVVLASGHVASTLGHLLYASLFNAKATGFTRSRPFVVAAVLTWVGYGFTRAAMSVPRHSSAAAVNDIELDL